MSLSVDTTLRKLLDDPKARSILEKHLGNRTTDPRVDQVMHETLRSISYYPEAGISTATLKAIDEELQAL